MEKTSFQNPSDPSREIFVFHDVPHLLKLLQNHIIDEGINIFSTTGLIYKSDFSKALFHLIQVKFNLKTNLVISFKNFNI